VRPDIASEDVSGDQDVLGRALRGSEASFRAIFEHAAIGIGVVDMDGRPRAVNPALAEMLGYTPLELAAMTFPEFTHPDDLQTDLELFAELMAGTRESYRLEKRYIRRDGEIVWGRLALSLIRDDEGRPEFAVAMLEDVTELRHAEAALRANEDRQRATQKLEAIGRLAGGIAHDFNNLLTVIIGSAEMLRSGDIGIDRARRDHVAQIQEAADRAATLTRQLLAFGRRQRFDIQVTDLNRVIGETLALLARVVPSDIAIESQLDPQLDAVWADPSQLEQVIMNLALNARDAMPDGGLFRITTANARLTDPLPTEKLVVPAGDYVVLTVSDDGVGMDATTTSHVFEPFFTTKATGSGTGLGLATVFGIVKQSDGFITVESEPERGTTFTIYLPKTTTAEARVETADQPPSNDSTTGPRTILVVDDNQAVRKLVTEMLAAAGYNVLSSPSAQSALDQAAEQDFQIDLVVSDVVMPNTSGPEFIAELRRRSPRPIRALYVSGYNDERLAASHGDEHFLSKPFTSQTLLNAVERALT
jgi:two-component system cell cycle sensor histidine kinase/response regulator CckA